MIKIGIIGLGNMGSTHLRVLSILKNVHVSFIYDKNFNLMKSFAKKYNYNFTHNINNELNKIDALIISSPTNTHYKYLKMSLGKVKNIFVEKPLTNYLDQTNEIFKLVKKFKTNIQIGMIERFNPVFETVKNIIKNEKKPIICKFNRSSNLSDRIKDTDVVYDLMIHDIDLALNFNGQVKKIVSIGKKINNMIKYVHSTFYHKNGTISIIEVSRITNKKIRNVSFLFKKAYCEVNLLNKEISISKNPIMKSNKNRGFFFNTQEQKIEVKPQEAALSQMNSFIKSCLKTKKINHRYYLDSLEICNSIKKSVKLF